MSPSLLCQSPTTDSCRHDLTIPRSFWLFFFSLLRFLPLALRHNHAGTHCSCAKQAEPAQHWNAATTGGDARCPAPLQQRRQRKRQLQLKGWHKQGRLEGGQKWSLEWTKISQSAEYVDHGRCNNPCDWRSLSFRQKIYLNHPTNSSFFLLAKIFPSI